MAWMLWLLAPVVSTVTGASVIWWRGRPQRSRAGFGSDPMARHQALLRALPSGQAADLAPVTMRVLPAEPAGGEQRSGWQLSQH